MIIYPYKYEGTWVFDELDIGLIKEPFVFGIPEMLDTLVADIKDASEGFKLIFSKKPFPGYQFKLTWIKEEYEGNWYRLNNTHEGWLCPALLKYFESAPAEIFTKAEKK
ncbi:hypothetical protein MNBD_GAMMA11-902 [hydrothermal vent metagenome]|uniref:Uncharacterized protein n=1 Tax=hydrothermal vent metagenome TaxID=652676 RepID=A0A3B0Y7I6_9ZZZZ